MGLLAVKKNLLMIDILVKPKKKAKHPTVMARLDAPYYAF